MSQQTSYSRAHALGHFAGGVALVIAFLAVVALVVRLPWGLAQPALDLIAAYPVVDALVRAAFICFVLIAVGVLFLIWWERKFAGWMQARLGPMHVGWRGSLQTVADALKLLTKEDIIPAKADRILFVAAPFIAFVPTVLTFLALPFSRKAVAWDYSLSVLFVMAVTTTAIAGMMAAGWGANNKYALLGGMRSAAQLLSYEIPMLVSVLAVVACTNTLSMTQTVLAQEGLWNVLRRPVLIPAFVIYLICAMAEVNRTPFDLPEAESELVSGFNTEYSGMRFAFFFLAEFANNFFQAAFAVVLFFGGWLGPSILPGPVWLSIKALALVTFMMWIRWTVPRFRIDQMMAFCWKLLVPASFLVFFAAALLGGD